MARQQRIDYPSAVHHVMNRGAAHQEIFTDDSDRLMFLELWSRAASRFDISIVSYALMDNHFHFLVVSDTGRLSEALKLIAQVYTQRFNARHGRDGALFRGRFHSVLVDSDAYFERVGRYIELNPAAAGLVTVDRLDRYKWSSFQFYTGRRRTPNWLTTEPMLSRYRTPQQYTRFVQSELNDQTLARFYSSPLRPSVVLGRSAFVQKIAENLAEEVHLEAGVLDIIPDEIDRAVSRSSTSSEEDSIEDLSAGNGLLRRVAVGLTLELTGASWRELADRYDYVSPSAAGKAARRANSSKDPNVVEVRSAALDLLGVGLDGHPIN